MDISSAMQGQLTGIRQAIGMANLQTAMKMRVNVKRLLRKYGYPSDKQETAIETAMERQS